MEIYINNLQNIFEKFEKYNINQNIKNEELKEYYDNIFNKINDYKLEETHFIQQLTSKISREDTRKRFK